MKRAFCKLLFFLAFGLLMQLGVALVFCLVYVGTWSGGMPTEEEYNLWYDHPLNLPGYLPDYAWRFVSPGFRANIVTTPVVVEPDGQRRIAPRSIDALPAREILFVYSAGWPMRSVNGALRQTAYTPYAASPWAPDAANGPVEKDKAIVISLPEWFDSGHRAIPYGPLFLGTLLNTLFYALLLWLLFFASFAARRALRRKRRLCEMCAYPVGTSPVCTECGARVSGNPGVRVSQPRGE
ncbi:MAG: hypothetical protein EA377_07490 [Phycisphaerales bacterium]|nr:MAG: hypothetical protein EA377_07490 [Phycisphaerales bacterium]